MAIQWLDFEKPITELEKQIENLREIADDGNISLNEEIKNLETKCDELKKKIFSELNIWQKVLLARHPQRPYSLDYIELIINDFFELHGDRRFGDDAAIITGIGKIEDQSVAVIGQQKGRNTSDNIKRNFGMPHPEGYRKALRVMRLAEKYNMPIITLIDTAGAYPGIGAEERGQAEAIAYNIMEMFDIKVPIICIVIGEGGSGGALAIAAGDKIAMLEYSIYSVISPEGCASILWGDAAKKQEAAEILKLTAPFLQKFGVIDDVLEEPLGGAHRNPKQAADFIKKYVLENIKYLSNMKTEKLLKLRREKFYNLGEFEEISLKNIELN